MGGKNVLIENVYAEKASDGPYVTIYKSKNFTIRNVETYNQHDYAVCVWGHNYYGVIENIRCIEPHDGYWGAVLLNTQYGASGEAIRNIIVRNIYQYKGGRDGAPIYLLAHSDSTIPIENVKISNVTIEDTTLYDGVYGAVAIRALGGMIKNVTIEKLTVNKTKNTGVYIRGTAGISNVLIRNSCFLDIATNPVDSDRKAGIVLLYPSADVVSVENCFFDNPSGAGQMDKALRLVADSAVPGSMIDHVYVRNFFGTVTSISMYGDRVYKVLAGGYAFSNSGSAVVSAGSTSVVVEHGLSITPDINRIKVTPKDNLAGRSFWVSDVTSTTFRINISSSDTVDHTFGWSYE